MRHPPGGSAPAEPVRYEIRVQGVLDSGWSGWFEGLEVTSAADDATVIAGPVTDQAALHGLLIKVRDLGLELLSVRRLDPDPSSPWRNRMSATVQDPRPLHELAPGLALARGGPGRTLNIYLLGDVVVDSGMRWSRRWLSRQLAGRRLSAHLLTHAHFDHAGCSAWLCHTFDLPLWCGEGDAAAISSGRVDTHGSPLVNRLQRT